MREHSLNPTHTYIIFSRRHQLKQLLFFPTNGFTLTDKTVEYQ